MGHLDWEYIFDMLFESETFGILKNTFHTFFLSGNFMIDKKKCCNQGSLGLLKCFLQEFIVL